MCEAIVPTALSEAVAASGFSPAVRAGELVFLTGATGGAPDGTMPDQVSDQIDTIRAKLMAILEAARRSPQAVVEMTSYHTDIADSFDMIDTRLRAALGLQLPAWTAVEVAGLRRPGARLKIRFVLYAPRETT